jgi:hypothetical protein
VWLASETTNRRWVAVGVIALAVGVSGCGGTHSKSRGKVAAVASGGARTRIVIVRPTSKAGTLEAGYTIKSRLRGECEGGARYASGAVYVCGTDKRGYEPCWPLGAGHETGEVFCLKVPWRRSGTEIALRKRWEVRLYPPEPHRIWRAELTTGQRCQPLHGAVSEYDGVPWRFVCGASGPLLIGEPDEWHEPWTIREVVEHPVKGGAPTLSEGPLGRFAVVWYAVGASK